MAIDYQQRFSEDLPSSLPVYRLEQPDRFPGSAVAASTLAQRLGLSGRATEVTFSDDWTVHREGPFDVAIHARSGGCVYQRRDHMPVRAAAEDRAFTLSDDGAVGVADRFVDGAELAPDDRRVLRVTHLRTQGGSPGGELQDPVVLDAGVVYTRVVDDVTVEGPGGELMVKVGPDEDVVGFRQVWRPILDVLADVEIRPPDEAYAAVERVSREAGGDVVVTRAGFGYFELGMADAQAYLQPAYVTYYVVQGEEVAFTSLQVTPAGDTVFEPIGAVGERFPTPPQPPRDGGGRDREATG